MLGDWIKLVGVLNESIHQWLGDLERYMEVTHRRLHAADLSYCGEFSRYCSSDSFIKAFPDRALMLPFNLALMEVRSGDNPDWALLTKLSTAAIPARSMLELRNPVSHQFSRVVSELRSALVQDLNKFISSNSVLEGASSAYSLDPNLIRLLAVEALRHGIARLAERLEESERAFYRAEETGNSHDQAAYNATYDMAFRAIFSLMQLLERSKLELVFDPHFDAVSHCMLNQISQVAGEGSYRDLWEKHIKEAQELPVFSDILQDTAFDKELVQELYEVWAGSELERVMQAGRLSSATPSGGRFSDLSSELYESSGGALAGAAAEAAPSLLFVSSMISPITARVSDRTSSAQDAGSDLALDKAALCSDPELVETFNPVFKEALPRPATVTSGQLSHDIPIERAGAQRSVSAGPETTSPFKKTSPSPVVASKRSLLSEWVSEEAAGNSATSGTTGPTVTDAGRRFVTEPAIGRIVWADTEVAPGAPPVAARIPDAAAERSAGRAGVDRERTHQKGGGVTSAQFARLQRDLHAAPLSRAEVASGRSSGTSKTEPKRIQGKRDQRGIDPTGYIEDGMFGAMSFAPSVAVPTVPAPKGASDRAAPPEMDRIVQVSRDTSVTGPSPLTGRFRR